VSQSQERTRRLLGALYREEFRSAAYRAYHRRAEGEDLRRMLDKFLQAQARMVGLLEGHLRELGAQRSGRGPLRRAMGALGMLTGTLTSLRGVDAILARIRSEEQRGARFYGDAIDWSGWSEEEKQTLEGHACDQLYQNRWAQSLQQSLQRDREDAEEDARKA
jgi:hypothetical protein